MNDYVCLGTGVFDSLKRTNS